MLEPTYIYRATCDRVIDGDTYVITVNLGLRCSVSIEARLHGIDVYEHNTPKGKAATVFVTALMLGKPLVVKTYKDERSFARWVCDIEVNGESLADQLRVAGFEKEVLL